RAARVARAPVRALLSRRRVAQPREWRRRARPRALPQHRRRARRRHPRRAFAARRPARARHAPGGRMTRILIVEDEPKLAALESDYLKSQGYDTHTIGDGLEVVPWVRANAPDLILLDLMLPGRDGLEVCRELRSFTDL